MMESTGEPLPTRHSDSAFPRTFPISIFKYKGTLVSYFPLIFKNGMLDIVIFSIYYFEIFNPVISLDMIPMVDYLRIEQWPSDVIFHNKTVLKYIGIFVPNSNIISAFYFLMGTLLDSYIGLISTFIRAIFYPIFNPVWPNHEFPKTPQAVNFYHEDIISC